MKKKIVSLLCMITVMVMLVGCTKETPTPAENQPGTATEEVKPEEKGEEEAAGGDIARPAEDFATLCYEYEEYVEYGEEGDGGFTKRYVLDIRDDKNAILTETNVYSEVYESNSIYRGQFEIGKDSIEFSYQTEDDGECYSRYILKKDKDDKITEVTCDYIDQRVETIVGKYTGTDEEYGKMSLDIRDNGGARLVVGNGTEYTGSVIVVDGKFDLMVSTDDGAASLDWYIFISGSTFTYIPYESGYTGSNSFAGTYHCFGMLGEADLEVDNNNNGSIALEVDGQELCFEGYIYCSDEDVSQIGGSYMHCTTAEYSLDLTFVYLESEGMWNYSGYLNTPLSAG